MFWTIWRYLVCIALGTGIIVSSMIGYGGIAVIILLIFVLWVEFVIDGESANNETTGGENVQ